MRREWYVYLLPFEDIPVGTVLSGYMTEAEAREESERVQLEIPKWRGLVLVLPRSDERILEYAQTHPAWAKREGFVSSLSLSGSPEHKIRPYSAEEKRLVEREVTRAAEKYGVPKEDLLADVVDEMSQKHFYIGAPFTDRYYIYFIESRAREIKEAEEELGSSGTSARRFRVWFTTPTGFERFVDIEATDEGEARRLAEKQVPAGSEFRFATEVSSTFAQAQNVPPHACPLCPKTVAGGPEEYLGHIRTAHPEEWRRLETDPSYTLRRAEAGITKCRFCGAPYLYRENLELHERSCPKRV